MCLLPKHAFLPASAGRLLRAGHDPMTACNSQRYACCDSALVLSISCLLTLTWPFNVTNLLSMHVQTLMEVYDKLVKCDECLPVAANEVGPLFE